jgi:hypothetical protein
MATEKIMIGIDDQVIELKGADKEAFIAERRSTRLAKSIKHYLKRSIKPSKMHAHQL